MSFPALRLCHQPRQQLQQHVRSICRRQLHTTQRRNVNKVPDMTYNRSVAQPAPPSSGGFRSAFYNNVFARSPIFYLFFFGVAVVADNIYDQIFDGYWASANAGKTFDEVIPKRFPNLPPGTEPDEPEEESSEEGGDDAEEGGDDKEEGGDDKEEGGNSEEESQDSSKNDDKKGGDSE